jgi:hypothetical protein
MALFEAPMGFLGYYIREGARRALAIDGRIGSKSGTRISRIWDTDFTDFFISGGSIGSDITRP